jgi:hypothetical protein
MRSLKCDSSIIRSSTSSNFMKISLLHRGQRSINMTVTHSLDTWVYKRWLRVINGRRSMTKVAIFAEKTNIVSSFGVKR